MPVRPYIYRGDRERHYPYPPVRQVLAPGDRIEVDDHYYPHDVPLEPEGGGVHWPRLIRSLREAALELAGHDDPDVDQAGIDLHALASRIAATPDPAMQDTDPGDAAPDDVMPENAVLEDAVLEDAVLEDAVLEDAGPEASVGVPKAEAATTPAAELAEPAAPSGARPPLRRNSKAARTKDEEGSAK